MESLIKNAQARADRTRPKFHQRIDNGEIIVSQIRANKPAFLRAKQSGCFWDIGNEYSIERENESEEE